MLLTACGSDSVHSGSTVDHEETGVNVTVISDQSGDSIRRFCDGPNMVYVDEFKNDIAVAGNDPRCVQQ